MQANIVYTVIKKDTCIQWMVCGLCTHVKILGNGRICMYIILDEWQVEWPIRVYPH